MEQLFGAIPAVLTGLGQNADIDEAVVFAAWTRCSGELMRNRTAPIKFFEARLVVAVEDKTWRRNLEVLSPQMLAKLNGSLGHGTVKFIEFRIDPATVIASRGESRGITAQRPPDHIAPSLAKAAEIIADPDLREKFLSSAAAYLANQREKVKK